MSGRPRRRDRDDQTKSEAGPGKGRPRAVATMRLCSGVLQLSAKVGVERRDEAAIWRVGHHGHVVGRVATFVHLHRESVAGRSPVASSTIVGPGLTIGRAASVPRATRGSRLVGAVVVSFIHGAAILTFEGTREGRGVAAEASIERRMTGHRSKGHATSAMPSVLL